MAFNGHLNAPFDFVSELNAVPINTIAPPFLEADELAKVLEMSHYDNKGWVRCRRGSPPEWERMIPVQSTTTPISSLGDTIKERTVLALSRANALLRSRHDE